MKVLVIGEECVDKFIYCQIDRLSPEAPVPVLIPIETTSNPGMAGNTIANVKAMSDASIMNIVQDGITKTRYVDKKTNHMFLRVDEGENNIKPFEWSMPVDMALGQADIVIVSDYNKGFLSNTDLKEIARKSTLSILDSKRKLTNDIVKEFSFIKLNELEHLNNPQLTTDNIITTLGKNGAKYKNVLFESPDPQDTIDVSGAGDTFTSAFILKYFETKDEKTAIQFANKKASEVVSQRGVVTPK